MLRARGFLTRLPNRPCTANLGLSVLEGSEIQFLAPVGHTELFLGVVVLSARDPSDGAQPPPVDGRA